MASHQFSYSFHFHGVKTLRFTLVSSLMCWLVAKRLEIFWKSFHY